MNPVFHIFRTHIPNDFLIVLPDGAQVPFGYSYNLPVKHRYDADKKSQYLTDFLNNDRNWDTDAFHSTDFWQRWFNTGDGSCLFHCIEDINREFGFIIRFNGDNRLVPTQILVDAELI